MRSLHSSSSRFSLPATPTRLRAAVFATIAMVVLFCGEVEAAENLYWNVATGNWETAANWIPTQLPTSADSVYIYNEGTAQVGAGITGLASYISVGATGFVVTPGSLILNSGGKVTSGHITIGSVDGCSTVTVDGSNSELIIDVGSILVGPTSFVGQASATGLLELTNGGKAISASHIYIGYGTTSYTPGNGTVTVNGSGSELKNTSGNLIVGDAGTGSLSLTNGGKAMSLGTAVGNGVFIGNDVGSTGTVTVDGTNSALTSANALMIGRSGTGLLELKNGGTVTSESDITFGRYSGSTGTATVGGDSELISTNNAIVIGFEGIGMLALTNGKTTASSFIIGYQTNGSGVVTVEGAGSMLATTGMSGYIQVGDYGTGTLSLIDGGKATARNHVMIGENGANSNGTITITGNDSELKSTLGSFYIGNSGTGTLNLTNGGKATSATQNIHLGVSNGSSGAVTVDGTDSVLTSGVSLTVGHSGTGTLNLANGGKSISTSHIYLASNIGSTGTVTVGSDSELKSTAGNVYVGGNATAARGTGVLSGSGTVIAANTVVYNTGTISPGDALGAIGTLTITGNANFQNSKLTIDLDAGSASDKIAISGTLTATGTSNITLSHLLNGSYTLLTAASGVNAGNFSITNTLSGRQSYNFTSSTSSALILNVFAANARLTWTAAGLLQPWVNGSTGWQGASTEFIDDDYVTFTSTGAGSVAVDNAGVVVSGMDVTGGVYSFSGGKITGVPNLSVGVDAIGALNVSGGSVTFNNDVDFVAVNIGEVTNTTIGKVIIGKTISDGTYSGAITFLGTGANELVYNSTTDQSLSGIISGAGKLTKDGAGTLTLSADSSAFTGTFQHNVGGVTLGNGAKLGGTYTQASGTTLTALGTATLGTATFAGTIDLGTALGTNKIAATGAVSFSGTSTINVNSNTNGTYSLITGSNITGAGNASIVNAADLSGKREGRKDIATEISYKIFSGATSLNWTGAASGNWDAATVNWKDGESYITKFAGGDSVTFDTSGANKNVTVAAGGVTVGTMTVSDNYSFSGGKITATGAVNVTGGSLGLDITTNAPMISAASVNFNGHALNITGYTPGTTLLNPSDTKTVITTTGGVSGFNPAIRVANQASADFLSASAKVVGSNVVVETRLSWDSTDPLRPAHGDFTIVGAGNSFTLGAALADNTASTNRAGWDGKSLAKKGDGTLTLTGANSYTGNTTVSAGKLILDSNFTNANTATFSIASGAEFELSAGRTFTNSGTFTNAGTFNNYGTLALTNGGNATSASNIYLGMNAGSTGTVTVGSSSTLTSTAGNVYVGGNTTASQGTGILAGSGIVVAGNTVVYSTGTISPGDAAGDIGTLTITGNANFQSANLEIDIAGNNVSDTIAISGALTTSGKSNITLSHLLNGSYTLLTAASGVNATDFKITNDPLERQSFSFNTPSTNQLILTILTDNVRLTWAPDPLNPKLWGDPDAKWQGGSEQFVDDDYVIFTPTGAGGVEIISGGVVVSGMELRGGAYTFSGGKITGVPNPDVSGSNGGLIVSGGSATFANVAEFKNIHIQRGGAVILSDGVTTFSSRMRTASVMSQSAVDEFKVNVEGVFRLDAGGSLTINAAENQITAGSLVLNGAVNVVNCPLIGAGNSVTIFDVIKTTDEDMNQAAFTGNNGLLRFESVFTDPRTMALRLTVQTPEDFVSTMHLGTNAADAAPVVTRFAAASEDFQAFIEAASTSEVEAVLDGFGGTAQFAAALSQFAFSGTSTTAYEHMLGELQFNESSQFRGQSGSRLSTRNVWLTGIGQGVTVREDKDAKPYKVGRGGVVVGNDWSLGSQTTLGVMFDWSAPRLRSDEAKIDGNSYVFGLYGRRSLGAGWHALSFAGIGFQTYDGKRDDVLGGYAADYGGRSMYAGLHITRPFVWKRRLTLSPTVGLDFQEAWSDGYVERERYLYDPPLSGVATVQDAELYQLMLRLGLNAAYHWTDRVKLRGHVRYGAMIAGDPYGTMNAALVAIPDTNMKLTSVNIGRNVWTLGTGGEWYVTPSRRVRMFADYDCDLSRYSTAHTGALGCAMRW